MIAVIGSLIRDLICKVISRAGDKIYAVIEEAHGGGGGRNVAIGARRLGLEVWLLGAVGRDRWGEALLRELRDSKVKTDFVQRLPDKITGFSLILEGKIISVRGANEHLSIPKDLDLGRFDWIYVASIPPHLQAELLEALETADYKPSLYLNPGGAQIAERKGLLRLLSYAKVIQMNYKEARKLVGEGDPTELVPCLRNLGAEIAIVTAGKEGAYAVSDKEELHQPPLPAANVVDPTGAGDAFGAGVLAGLVKGLPLEDALQIGAANAAAVAEHQGVQGFLDWDEALERAGLAKPVTERG